MSKRYELHFLDTTLEKKKWIYWKKYHTEKGAYDAAKALLNGLWKDAGMAKIRDAYTGDESLFSA